MLEGINYLHAKLQINILKTKIVIYLLELWQLWQREVALTITEELNKSNKMFKSLLTIILVLPVLIFFRELIVVANFVACLFVPFQVTSSSSGVFTQITIE